MKTYWDYEDAERANLTEDEVRSLLNVELMTAGVLRPEPPKLTEVQKSPLGERKKFFGVIAKGKYGSDESLGIVFDTIDAAQAFIQLNPSIRDYDYEVGSEFTYVKSVSECKIAVEELYSLDQINVFRVELKQRKAQTEANQKAQSAFNEASSKADRVTERVWSDWFEKRDVRDNLRRVVLTYQEYLTLTSGDINMALSFLEKAHTVETISKAREWFPGQIGDRIIALPAQPEVA